MFVCFLFRCYAVVVVLFFGLFFVFFVFFLFCLFFFERRGGGRGQGVHVGDGRRFKELYLKFFGVIP